MGDEADWYWERAIRQAVEATAKKEARPFSRVIQGGRRLSYARRSRADLRVLDGGRRAGPSGGVKHGYE